MFNWLTYRILAYIAAGLGAVVIALSVALWARGVEVGKARNDRDKAKNQVAEALRTIDEQKTALKVCSDRTDELKAEGLKRRSEADEELAKLRKQAERYQASDKRLASLTAVPTPPGAGCSQALAAIRRELRK